MAFIDDGLKLIAPGGAISTGSGSVKNVYHFATNDTLTTVLADGYFDGITGDPLNAGDTIHAVCDVDGTPTSAMLLVTVGGSDVTVIAVNSEGPLQTISTAGAVANTYGTVKLNDYAAFAIGTPIEGVDVVIVAATTSTGDTATVIPSSTAVKFDYAGNRKLTFNARDDAVILRGVSTTQFVIVGNEGAVTAGST